MRAPHRRAVAALAAAAGCAVALTGCGASSTPTQSAAAGTTAASVAAGATPAPGSSPVTRWWHNAAVTAGSTIDPADPTAAVSQLHPSDTDYCGMLRETVQAGRSLFPDATATDPAVQTATTAFVAELQEVAPADISGDWQVLGHALLALVRSGGTAAPTGAGPAAVGRAAARVAADATTRCKVSLAAPTRAAGK